MVSTLDILYIVLSFSAVVLTAVLVVLGIETIRIVRDIRAISRNVEHITLLVERVAGAVFPGIEKAAKGVDIFGTKMSSFLKKKSEIFK